MKTSELITIQRALINVQKCTDPRNEVKGYADMKLKLAKNIKLIKNHIENYNDVVKAHEELISSEIGTAYETERIELAEKYAKKDEDQKPIIENGQYQMENIKAFNKAFEKLKEKHAAYLKEFEDSETAINLELDAELPEIELRKIKSNQIPSDIEGRDLNILIDLIEEIE